MTSRRIGRAPSGASGLHERIALSGPRDEIAELADTFDAMLERLDRSFDLAVHRDPTTGTVVLEYASEGRTVEDGRAYANRYVSVLTIADRQVTRWRDYLDPLAVFDALGWPETT